MPDSLRPHGLQPTRLPCPWDFPGKDTGVGCHFLLQGIFPTQGSNLGLLHCRQILDRLSYKGSAAAAAAAKLLQSCPTLCDPIEGSQPGSSVPGILQARILEWALLKPNTNQCLRFDQHPRASLAAQAIKNLPAMQETCIWSLGREGPWGIPRTQKPGCYRGSLFVTMGGSQIVGHDCVTNTFTFTLNILHIPQMTRRKENSKIREKNPENIFYQGWYIFGGTCIFGEYKIAVLRGEEFYSFLFYFHLISLPHSGCFLTSFSLILLNFYPKLL